MKKQLTYLISKTDKALAFEWIVDSIDTSKFELSFVLFHDRDTPLEAFLKKRGVPVTRIQYHSKKDLLPALFKTIRLLKKNRTDVVHTHLFEANLIGLLAAYWAGINKRIYTRHHSNYHHLYHPKAVKYDRFINALATDIVAISAVTKNVMITQEAVPAAKITLIHHGFDLNLFLHPDPEQVKQLQQKYNATKQYPVIGVISRYTEWKGIQYILPAFQRLLADFPTAKLVLANAKGDYSTEIKKQLKSIPQDNYLEIEFEENIAALYPVFDVFVHTPISKEVEAFGQIYVEALAAGIPSVFTRSGIANEFIVDKQDACIVDYRNSDAIYEALTWLLEHPAEAKQLSENGKKAVVPEFGLTNMMNALMKLYEN